MKKLFKNIRTKTNKIAFKASVIKSRAIFALSNNRGEGTVSQAITILISVILGALLLAGLYALFNEVILPRLTIEINEMFDYNG